MWPINGVRWVATCSLWTNEEPPFLNKAGINTLLPYFVDGERSMQWVSDRFQRAAHHTELRSRGFELTGRRGWRGGRERPADPDTVSCATSAPWTEVVFRRGEIPH